MDKIKLTEDKKKGSGWGTRLLMITGIAVVLLSAMALYLMRPSPVEQDVGLIDEEESEEDKCVFRRHPDNDTGIIRTAYRNYPDTVSELSGHLVELTN